MCKLRALAVRNGDEYVKVVMVGGQVRVVMVDRCTDGIQM